MISKKSVTPPEAKLELMLNLGPQFQKLKVTAIAVSLAYHYSVFVFQTSTFMR